MTHRLAAVLAVLAAACPAFADAAAKPAAKPNILLIVADDLGWADVGWHGSKIRTPHLDKLVAGGVELDFHYVQPVCTPTRTALMSGRYPGRFGPHALVPSNLRAMPAGTETLASALRSVGYRTWMSGKWHLGSKQEWGPTAYGFQHGYGSLTGAVDPWTHQYRKGPYAKTWHRDGVRLDEEGNATELVAAEAVRRIREGAAGEAPWFLYVPFHAVHIPVDTPEAFKKEYAGGRYFDDPKRDESFKRYAAFVSQLDAKVGEFVAELDRTGQRDRTLIVFTSDNGGLEKGGNAYISEVAPTPQLGSNLPLRGQKGTLYEGGVRVCAFAHWAGKLTPRKVAAPMHAVDWFPTLAGVAGYAPAKPLNWDGRDMWKVLAGEQAKPEPRTIYIAARGGAAVRHGDWKLIVRGKGSPELFDLAADPYEKTDLAGSQPEKVKELRAVLAAVSAADAKELPADLEGESP